LKDDKPDKNFKAAFLTLSAGQPTFMDLYRCDAGLQEGFFLDDYVGATSDEKIVAHLFKDLQNCVATQLDDEERRKIQAEMIDIHRSADAWRFIDS
jgi:hypothetical protein